MANAASGLLTPDENKKLWEIIQQPHRKNQTLAVAVVKLYLSDASTNHKVWMERVTGAVSFTKDYGRKSYFLQIFDMQYYQPVWEQEVYREIVYKAPQLWFHSFEAENNMAGLSFADEREGQNFLAVVQKKIAQRYEKIQNHQQKTMVALPSKEKSQVAVSESPQTPARNDKKKKKKISVLDISGPVSNSFVHVSGVKTDGSGGMKMVDNSHLVDPVVKNLLKVTGLDANNLGAGELEQVRHFAQEQNLYEVYDRKRSVRRQTQSPPKQTSDLQPKNGNIGHRTPTSTLQGQKRPSVPAPVPTPSRPAVNAPTRAQRTLPPPPPHNGPPPPPPPQSGPPTPPLAPPLPPPTNLSGKPLPPTPPSVVNKPDLKANLLGQINNFDTSTLTKSKPKTITTSSNDSRDDVMNAIRAGVKLNKVPEAEKNDRSAVKSGNDKSSKPGDSKTGGIMGLLASHLDAFHNANFSDSEEDENDDEDDWSE